MRMTINTGKGNHLIEIEADLSEVVQIINGLSADNIIVSKPTNSLITPAQAAKPAPLDNAADYVRSLFVYEPNKNTYTGKAPHLATRLVDGNNHKVANLIKDSNCTIAVVHNVVRRMTASGATLSISTPNKITKDTVIRVVSIPKGPFTQLKRKNAPKPTASKPTVSKRSNTTVIPSGILSAVRAQMSNI